MNNKITNPFLKQILTEISSKASEGRIADISWSTLNEAKKKKRLTKEATKDPNADIKDEPSPQQPPEDSTQIDGPPEQEPAGGGLPDLGGGKEDTAPDVGVGDQQPEQPSEEDTEQAQADATKAKADLEKAKAEKDQAEQELKDHSYIKLSSQGGTNFLLSKILDHSFKTNTIDALAGEMVGKLKIDTQEDMNSFIEDLAPFMVIPGMAQLISSMKGLANKPSPTTDSSSEESPTT